MERQDRRLRADAERSVQKILEAAELVLRDDPGASMAQIAEAAGVARTTVHRRFATREALIGAMTLWATRRFDEAVQAARPETAPPLIALYQVTANVLRVKIDWGFAMGVASADPEVARVHAHVRGQCDQVFRRARDEGMLRPDTDLDWMRRVYYALIQEAARNDAGDTAPDALATLIMDTLLRDRKSVV